MWTYVQTKCLKCSFGIVRCEGWQRFAKTERSLREQLSGSSFTQLLRRREHLVGRDLLGADVIEQALQRINPLFREPVVLRDIMDLSYEEIASVLEISLGTVKSRILRGREALREELAGTMKARQSLLLAPEGGRVTL